MALILGTNEPDLLLGTDAADVVHAFHSNDTLYGRAGNDLMTGGEGVDTLFGEAGNDVLDGRGGGDTLDGGAGRDTVVYANARGPVAVDLGLGTASGGTFDDSEVLISIEDVLGSRFGDTLIGSSAANGLVGNGGDDTLRGLDGNDYLDGWIGDDTLDGGNGIDTVNYFSSVTVDLAAGTATSFGFGNDVVIGVENVLADFGNTIYGSAASNRLVGGGLLDGRDGNDVLEGRGGNDTLSGGNGNDTLRGDPGDDVLTGGAGRDRFVFQLVEFEQFPFRNTGHDRIVDFRHDDDVLAISVLGTSTSPAAVFDALDSDDDQKVTGADAFADQVGGSLVLDLDALNVGLGFGGGDASVTLTGVAQLVPSDFG